MTLIERMRASGLTITLRRLAGRAGVGVGVGLAERVADAVHRAHDAVAQLAAQGADVGVDRAGARPVAVAPHVDQEPLARQDPSGALGQAHQQVELGGGEVHDLAVLAHAPGVEVDLDVVVEPEGAGRAPPGEDVDAAEEGLHPRHQLPHRERLGHVVVGSHGEADHQVGLVVARGEHQHGHVAVALDQPAHLEAVHAREHQVEDDQVGLEPLGVGHPGGPVAGDVDLHALAAQAGGDRVGDQRLVLHHHDAAGHARTLDGRAAAASGRRRPTRSAGETSI
ncbi:MAG: hypothetical protein R2711_14750 [Acidimicrobiales bacterium]